MLKGFKRFSEGMAYFSGTHEDIYNFLRTSEKMEKYLLHHGEIGFNHVVRLYRVRCQFERGLHYYIDSPVILTYYDLIYWYVLMEGLFEFIIMDEEDEVNRLMISSFVSREIVYSKIKNVQPFCQLLAHDFSNWDNRAFLYYTQDALNTYLVENSNK